MGGTVLIPGSIRDTSTIAINELISRLEALDISQLLIYLIDSVDATALPHLIDQFHVAGIEGSNLAENAANRRSLVKQAIIIHRLKGTLAGLRQAIRSAGFGEIEIIEQPNALKYDGSRTYSGLMVYGNPSQWATYYVVMLRAVTNGQADLIRQLCIEFAPARCHLLGIDYTAAAIRYNDTAHYDGSYNHGAV
jgi:hypothetical protein